MNNGKREAGSGKRKVVYLAAGALLLACTKERPAPEARAPETQSGASSDASRFPLPASRAPASRKAILFVGTSLTAGYGLDADSAYPQQIQNMIDSAALPYTVVNAGVSGETSSAMLRRLDWLLRQPFDVIVIETGANDGLRGISVDAMRENIQRAIARIRQARPAARIVLVQMEALPNMGRAYTQQFRNAFPRLAKDNHVVLLPFLLDGVAGRGELNQADGIHPNYDGERIVARNVWKGLRPILQ
ncbi:MAG TPA: arylesterase [Gemmatimonadaceae bacterium]